MGPAPHSPNRLRLFGPGAAFAFGALHSAERLPGQSLQVVGSASGGFGSYRHGCEILGQAGEKRAAFFGGNP